MKTKTNTPQLKEYHISNFKEIYFHCDGKVICKADKSLLGDKILAYNLGSQRLHNDKNFANGLTYLYIYVDRYNISKRMEVEEKCHLMGLTLYNVISINYKGTIHTQKNWVRDELNQRGRECQQIYEKLRQKGISTIHLYDVVKMWDSGLLHPNILNL